MKMDLDWHRECLKHQRASLEQSKAELEAVQARHARDNTRVAFYQRQLDVAVGEGKGGFDRELFLKKERPESIR